MPSFDIVSQVELQNVDNAVNSARKEMDSRFDFKGTNSEVNLDKKNMVIELTTENDFRIDQMEKVLIGRFVKARIDPQSLDLSKDPYASGKVVKKEIPVMQGIDRETCKKIVKAIKEAKIKVEAAIMDDQVRVTSKKIDNLQEVISLCRQTDFGLPLQYINMK